MTVKIIVHTFSVGDVEDPEIYAAEPIWNWQQSEAGRFVMEHAIKTPSYHSQLDYNSYGYQYAIRAEFTEVDATFFQLKYGNC
jgi:hypothetical protein